MANDVEYTFMYLLAVYNFFKEISIQNLCSILIGLFVFLLLSWKILKYILCMFIFLKLIFYSYMIFSWEDLCSFTGVIYFSCISCFAGYECQQNLSDLGYPAENPAQ